MKQFNIYLTIKGPGGQLEVPNNTNPVHADTLRDVLEQLAKSLPQPFGCETIAVRVEEAQR